jgi:hypothetical protein
MSAVSAPDNTPTATTKLTSAFLTQLGMTNNYTNASGTGNTASCDVLSTGGDPNPLSTGYTWRVRGTPNNGWADAAPQDTQGMEADVSTVGYTNITFSFDWFSTTQGIADLQLQYNTNINNANGWTDWTGSYNGNQATVMNSSGDTLLVATSNGYNTTMTNVKLNTVDLSGISGAANDANFGIRLVSAWDPTLQGYASAAGGAYNNSSGNWRFDQIAVQGVAAAPELPTGIVFAVAGLGLIVLRARRA